MSTDNSPDVPYGLIEYMAWSHPYPLQTITSPSSPGPFNFGLPDGRIHEAFNQGDDVSQEVVAQFKAHCQQRQKDDGGHTVLVVLWHANNQAPIIKERVVRGDDQWALSHDTEFLKVIGDRLDRSGRNEVGRFHGRRGWSDRGVHDFLARPCGGCILLRNIGVKRMPGFGNISKAFKKACHDV